MGLVALRQRRPRNAEQHFRDALARDPGNVAALDNLRTVLQTEDPAHVANVLREASRRESRHPQAHVRASRLAGAPTAMLAVVFVAALILLPRAGNSVGEAAAAAGAVLLLLALVVLRRRYRPTGLLDGGAGPRRVRLLWFLGSCGVILSLATATSSAVIAVSDLLGASMHSQWDVLLLATSAALVWLAASLVRLIRRVRPA
jgi:MYXO-CTERM domain-containing protein